MELLHAREPVSALTHGVWLLAAIPATAWLWKRGAGDRKKQLSLLVYGVSLAACFGGSALCHRTPMESANFRTFHIIDHIGIYFLIAGTYTPIAWNLLSGAWRRRTLVLIWVAAAMGAGLEATQGALPPRLITVFHLAMGWSCILCYAEVARAIRPSDFRPLIAGGLFYSIGAALNLMHWPVLWPGWVGAHEVFHLFAMLGSLAHFDFMLNVIVPFPARTQEPRWLLLYRLPRSGSLARLQPTFRKNTTAGPLTAARPKGIGRRFRQTGRPA